MTKKRKILIIFQKLLGMLKPLEKTKKVKKKTFPDNIGHAQHAQACPGCPPLAPPVVGGLIFVPCPKFWAEKN